MGLANRVLGGQRVNLQGLVSRVRPAGSQGVNGKPMGAQGVKVEAYRVPGSTRGPCGPKKAKPSTTRMK